MNKLKSILFLFLLLPLCVKPIVLDSLQKQELIAQGVFKLNALKKANQQKILEGKTNELDFIVTISPDNNIDYINDYSLNTGKPKFLSNTTIEQQLNSRLQQVYINKQKECYLILINSFDVKIDAPIPFGLTIHDVFNKGKFFNEQSNIEAQKQFHNTVVTQISDNSIPSDRKSYILSCGAYCGAFFKNEKPGCYYYWYSLQKENLNNPPISNYQETFDYLNIYLKNSNDFKHPTTVDDIAEQMVAAFENAVVKAELKAQILTTTNSVGISNILHQFTKAEDYSALTAAERIHILKIFTGESMGSPEEVLSVNVLKNTPSTQYQEMLDGLKNTANNFSDNLISLLSWRMDGDNFLQYLETITVWMSQKYPSNETWLQILQKQDRTKRTIIEFSADLLDGYGNTVSYSGNDVCFEVTKNFQIPISTITKCADVYGYALVKFNTDFSFNEREFKAGELIKMPALYAHLLFNKSSNDKLKTVGKVTLNLVLFSVGVGEINSATTVYETTIALIDMSVAVSDLIINEGFAGTLNQTPEGQSFLDVWNKINLIYGGTRIVTELTGLSTQFKSYGNQLKDGSILTIAEKQEVDALMTKVDEMVVANSVLRFIANSENELKTFLTSIVDKPIGKTYTGKFYKSVNKNAEALHNAKPDIISPYSIEEAWGRFDKTGESGMYYSKTISGNQTEMEVYGSWTDYSTYEFNNIQIDNMLDLTDDAIRQQLAIEFEQMVKSISNTGNEAIDKTKNYEFTNAIGTWAREKGYKGIIAPGARGNKDYVNVVVFNQIDLTTALSGQIPTKLK